jgi:putative ABC transport system permease protein
MGGFWQDIRYAIRSLIKSPGFTAVVVLILALGIGANVAMYSIIDTAMIRSLPYAEPERLVMGRATFNGNVNPWASAYDFWDYQELSTSFENLAAFWGFPVNGTVTGGERPERLVINTASRELFPLLGVRPQIGRLPSGEEALEGAPSVALISHGLWQRRYGGAPDVIGRTMTLDGTSVEIIGVMPRGFSFRFAVDVWLPMRPDSPFVGARRFHNWLILGRLKPGVTLAEAQSEVDVISAQLEAQYPDSNTGKALLLTELQEAMVEGYRASLFMLMAAVVVVLLIACGNVAGLLLAHGSTRRTELSLRAALGASAGRVVRQLLTESVVMAVVAGIFGTLVALWLQDLFVQLLQIDLPGAAEVGLSLSMLGFALLVSVVTGLVFGIVPAIRASRGELVDDLKSGVRTTDAGGAKFRSGLVVVQVAFSIMLLVGAGLLIRSFTSLTGVDPGFDARNLLTAEISLRGEEYSERDARIQFFTGLREEVRAIPGVESVAFINQLPILNPGNNTYVWPIDRPPLDPADQRSAFARGVLPGYFDAMGIPLLSGRDIQETDTREAPPVLVISRAMADTFFPGQDPIGKQVVVDFGDQTAFEIVGVVEDVRASSLAGGPFYAFYTAYWQMAYSTMRVAVRTAVRPQSIIPAFREAVWSLDGDIPLDELATMDEVLSRSVAGWRVRAVALTIFAAVALLLAAVGLYGVLAYYVSRRQYEIGIRVAMGAAEGDIVELVLKRGLALVGLGLVIGLAGSVAVSRLLEDMLFRVEATDLTTFVAVSLFFIVVAVLACLLPAWRALRVQPAIALQAE